MRYMLFAGTALAALALAVSPAAAQAGTDSGPAPAGSQMDTTMPHMDGKAMPGMDGKTPPAGTTTAPKARPDTTMTPPAAPPARAEMPAPTPAKSLKVGDLKGKTVVDPQGVKVGSIDQVVSQQGEKVSLIVGNEEGIFGFGEKQVAVPIDKAWVQADGHIGIDMTKESFAKQPKWRLGSAMSTMDEDATVQLASGRSMGTQTTAATAKAEADRMAAAAPATEADEPTGAISDARDPADSSTEAGLIASSVKVVDQMKADETLGQMMGKAKGVFIVPERTRGALVVGAQGGDGVFMAHKGTEWSAPIFYSLGGLSIGAQAGGDQGPAVFLLMSEKAVNHFKSRDDFALDASAGLTLAGYNKSAEANLTGADVVIWQGGEGAYAGASLGVKKVSWDEERNARFYNEKATATEILGGSVKPTGDASKLKAALTG